MFLLAEKYNIKSNTWIKNYKKPYYSDRDSFDTGTTASTTAASAPTPAEKLHTKSAKKIAPESKNKARQVCAWKHSLISQQ